MLLGLGEELVASVVVVDMGVVPLVPMLSAGFQGRLAATDLAQLPDAAYSAGCGASSRTTGGQVCHIRSRKLCHAQPTAGAVHAVALEVVVCLYKMC